MGAYVSIHQCEAKYGVKLDCDQSPGKTGQEITSIAGTSKGHFKPDPDIAGIGVVGVFIAVTAFALCISCLHLLWSAGKIIKKCRHPEFDTGPKSGQASVSRVLERIILACSDQQIFTGGAYALTLRFWRGCDISAYHYNVVANMLLLSCATHLMSISLCSQYWKYPWISWIRLLVMTGLFIVTGILLSNQASVYFPTEVPTKNETFSLLFMPAACFQGKNTMLIQTLQNTFDHGADHLAKDVIGHSSPKTHMRGWNFFVLIMLWYAVALFVQIFKVIRDRWPKSFRCDLSRPGRKLREPRSLPLVRWLVLLFGLYQFCGIGLSFATVALCAAFIMKLRTWVRNSGWIQLDNGQNPEDDATSFGQLVPIFLCALIIFAFIDTANEEICQALETRKDNKESILGDVETLTESTIGFQEEKKPLVTVQSAPVLPMPSIIDFQPLCLPSTASQSPYATYCPR